MKGKWQSNSTNFAACLQRRVSKQPHKCSSPAHTILC